MTTYRRAPRSPRVRRAMLDVIVISAPGSVAFAGWAIASWLITGRLSRSSPRVREQGDPRTVGATHPGALHGLAFAATCIAAGPDTDRGSVRGRASPVAAPEGSDAGTARSDLRCRPGLQSLTYAAGGTFAFLRFYIIVVPFAAALSLLAVPDGVFVRRSAADGTRRPTTRSRRRGPARATPASP